MTNEALRANFSGDIIEPSDSGYEQVRSTKYSVVGSPAVVLRPKSVDDVVAAVNHVRDAGLVLSVRGGGHHGEGFGTNVDGAVIDMSELRSIEVLDPASRRVRIGAGAVWGDVARYLRDHGLAITSGDTTSVGVGGLTLGGGMGWLVRKYGLAIDSLVAADVVTADGRVLRADAEQNADLFWALRGGGGNFGVVTAFEFTAFELGRVFAGFLSYPLEQAGQVLRGWRDAMREAPEELNSTVVLMPGFGDVMPPAAMVLVCYGGSDESAALSAIKPLEQLGTLGHREVQEKDYADILEDPPQPAGVRPVVKSIFAREFSDELIQTVAGAARPGGQVFQVRSLGGGFGRVPADATAVAQRDSEVMLVAGQFVPADAGPEVFEAADQAWQPFAALGTGSYANFVNRITEADIRAVYPEPTYQRLAQVKAAYDPNNLFSQNINIKPAG